MDKSDCCYQSYPAIQNVKNVIVPNTKGMKGLKASVAEGIVAVKPDNGALEAKMAELARLYHLR